ncbi:unnamed protein product [Closterium sp. NIES-54]
MHLQSFSRGNLALLKALRVSFDIARSQLNPIYGLHNTLRDVQGTLAVLTESLLIPLSTNSDPRIGAGLVPSTQGPLEVTPRRGFKTYPSGARAAEGAAGARAVGGAARAGVAGGTAGAGADVAAGPGGTGAKGTGAVGAVASALVAELVDFAAVYRLDYATSLVAESATASVCRPFVGGDCALGTDVIEDRHEEFECFASLAYFLCLLCLTCLLTYCASLTYSASLAYFLTLLVLYSLYIYLHAHTC